MFVSSEFGLRKPDPAAFAAVARRAGFQTPEILSFDDTAENITGARVAGMQAVLGIDTARRPRHAKATRNGAPDGWSPRRPPSP